MTEPTTQELIDWLDEYARKQAVFAGDELGEDPLVASRIKMLRAIVERLRAMQWRKVSEAPKDGSAVLVQWASGHVSQCEYKFGQWCYTSIGPMNPYDIDIRGWMPLPRLPHPPEGEK